MRALTAETAKLLEPIEVRENDRLEVRVTNDSKYFLLRIYSERSWEEDGESRHQENYPSWQASKLFRRFPESNNHHGIGIGEHLKVGATDTSAEIIRSVWPKDQVNWHDADAKLLFKYLIANKARQDLNAENFAHFKEHNMIPLHGYELHPYWKLAEYQQLGLCNSVDNEGYALFMEQGTGKSAIVVARICNEAKRRYDATGVPYFAIIVCPKQLRMNWENEFHKFATQPGRVTRISGSELKRTKQLIEAVDVDPEDRYSVVIISYDSVGRTQGMKMMKWDLGVLDEGHFIKNSGTLRCKAALDLRERCRQRMVLTGTPITNTVLDLYTQWEFLGDGWSGFTSHTAFRQFYGVFEERDGYTGFAKLVGVQNLPFMKERLARQSLVVKKSEVLKDLPDKQYEIIEVEMSEEQTDLYNKVRDEVMIEVQDELNSGHDKTMTMNNILTKMLRMAQVTAGHVVYDAVYDPDGNEIRERIVDRIDPNPKIETIVEILKNNGPNDKTIIWSHFVPPIKTLMGRLELEGIDAVSFYGKTTDNQRDEAVRRFNEDPRCKVFVGNQAAGGTGLNLLGYVPGENEDLYDTNANTVIYLSQGWSMPHRAQSEDRAHRRGTRQPVRYIDLLVDDTIDKVIFDRVMNKIQMADDIADVKNILSTVFNRIF